ncbi:FCG2B protein, partial [Campylorhamphus procurvoides]|nr:FCG2B protein [Campylorhamphus procurvoides]
PLDHPTDELVLQVPTWALQEGDRVTLRCRARRDTSVTQVRFYHEGKELRGPLKGTELSLSPLGLHHGGRYHCGGKVGIWSVWKESAPVTVTVH